MEAEIFQAIKTQIESNILDFNFIAIWNNHVEKIKSQDEEGAPIYSINLPALFVEYQAPNDIEQLGGGYQLYDPLYVRIHIVHPEIDSADGNLDQNLNVFDLKQRVFKMLQGFEPTGCVAFVRILEEQEYDHTNVYHYVQTYQTNYVDSSMSQPVNGQQTAGDTTLDETVVITTELDIETDL